MISADGLTTYVAVSLAGDQNEQMRTEAHLEDYLAALDYRFTAEDEALVDALVSPGHPSTPGYNDPQYPIEGRAPTRS